MNIFRLHISARIRRQETLRHWANFPSMIVSELVTVLKLMTFAGVFLTTCDDKCLKKVWLNLILWLNLKIHSKAVRCCMGYLIYYISIYTPKNNSSWCLVYGGFLTLTHSHLNHYWHFPTMVGFCHGGNMLENHHHHHHHHHVLSRSLSWTWCWVTLHNRCRRRVSRRWWGRGEKRSQPEFGNSDQFSKKKFW